MTFDALDHDVLVRVCSWLNPYDLVRASQTCHSLRASSRNESIWEEHCHRKWHNPNSSLFRRQPGDAAQWKALYGAGNGIPPAGFTRELLFDPSHAPPGQLDEGPVVLCCAATPSGTAAKSHAVAASDGDMVHVMLTGQTRAQRQQRQQCFSLPKQHPGAPVPVCSALTWLGGGAQGRLLAGTLEGAVYQCSVRWDELTAPYQPNNPTTVWPHTGDAGTALASTDPTNTGRPQLFCPQNAIPVADMVILGSIGNEFNCPQTPQPPPSGLLAVVHDALLLPNPHPPSIRGCIRLFDLATGQQTGAEIVDMLDGWSMAAVAARGAGCEALALSVDGRVCSSCWAAGIPWLCYHKPPARSCALHQVDPRVPGALAARFELRHRSAAPRIACVRQHCVLTSHADRPLVAWDLRAMSVPLFTQEKLDHMAQGLLDCATSPRHSHTHQSLWLSANEDVAVGRADNGCVWVWDLAGALGWGDGSMPGAWEVMEEVGVVPEEGLTPELRALQRGAWPLCLGGPSPGASNMPLVQLLDASDPLGILMLAGSRGWAEQGAARGCDAGDADAGSGGPVWGGGGIRGQGHVSLSGRGHGFAGGERAGGGCEGLTGAGEQWPQSAPGLPSGHGGGAARGAGAPGTWVPPDTDLLVLASLARPG